MPNYKYNALTEDGTIVTGVLTASNEQVLRKELGSSGLHVTKIRHVHKISLVRKPKHEEILLFVKEFRVLLRTGVTVPDALATITEHCRGQLATYLQQVRVDILRGNTLLHAFERHIHIFEPMFISMIATGEQSGELVRTLRYYESYLKQRMKLGRKMKQALIYPAFILLFVSLIMIVIFEFSLPRFVEIYSDMGSDLPVATQWLLSAGSNFHYLLLLLAGSAVALYSVLRMARRHDTWAHSIDCNKLRLPVVGHIQRAYLVSTLGHTLSSLLHSSMPLVNALKQCASTMPNRYFSNKLKLVAREVEGGQSLANAIAREGFLPTLAQNIIIAGEKSGSLAEQFEELSSFYDEEVEHRLSLAIALVEPVMILLTGIVVGGIVIIMYLPIFGLSGAIS